MSEKYGTSAQIVESIAAAPVSTGTNVVFIGYAPIHLVPGWKKRQAELINFPLHCQTLESYERAFGPASSGMGPEDPWTLQDGAHAALSMLKISSAYFVNAFDPGTPETKTEEIQFVDGVAYVPTGGVLSADDFTVADATLASVELVAHTFRLSLSGSHPGTESHSVTMGTVKIDNLTAAGLIGSAAEQSGVYAVLRMVPDNGAIANVICAPRLSADAALRTALESVVDHMNSQWMGFYVADAPQDAGQVVHGLPVSSAIKKTAVSGYGVQCWPYIQITPKKAISLAAYCAARYAYQDAQNGGIPMRSIGNLPVPGSGACIVSKSDFVPVSLDKPAADDIQYKGLITLRNLGGGQYRTWGDHTAAFSGGIVADELFRFDSRVRVQIHIANRFQQKYAPVIDDPLTLAQRNNIIAEEDSYLDYLRSQGALVGDDARCVFSETNTPDGVASGQFVWDIFDTVTPPLKSAEVRIAYTDSGLSAYYSED